MARRPSLLAVFAGALLASCANFKILKQDLEFMERTTVVSVRLSNVADQGIVHGIVVEWDSETDTVLSGDIASVGPIGVFSFFVRPSPQQYLLAFGDLNGDKHYQPEREAAWIHSDASGRPIPIPFDGPDTNIRIEATLSLDTILPAKLIREGRAFLGDKSFEEVATGWSIPIDLGTIADLDSEMFSAKHGNEGLWEPASFTIESGIGLYFLEDYDPNRIPVLFIYGATGSPQNWNTFFESLDPNKYQAWFYYYPSGRRLGEMGAALNSCVNLLQEHYKFTQLHVVAHSMGGLVSRAFVLDNLAGGHRYIQRFVTLSTPWEGHQAVNAGIKMAPAVVPSWYDIQPGSSFLESLFETQLGDRVDSLLIYSHHASRSLVLPKKNDGTVSVASQTALQAKTDSDLVLGFDETHVSILHSLEVIQSVQDFLNEGSANLENTILH